MDHKIEHDFWKNETDPLALFSMSRFASLRRKRPVHANNVAQYAVAAFYRLMLSELPYQPCYVQMADSLDTIRWNITDMLPREAKLRRLCGDQEPPVLPPFGDSERGMACFIFSFFRHSTRLDPRFPDEYMRGDYIPASLVRRHAAGVTAIRDVINPPSYYGGFDMRKRGAKRFTQCLTSDVVALARNAWESRDFSSLPILADALQEAGCPREDILAHLRGPGPHFRGCWALTPFVGDLQLPQNGV